MERKFILKIMIVFALFIAAIQLSSNNVQALEICDDGEYSLILGVSFRDYDADIDGEQEKLIRFNFDKDETTVKVSDITGDIEGFNGITKFKGWGKNSNSEELVTELKVSDFSMSGATISGSYEKGLRLYAKFSDEKLKDTGKYYITIDAFGGKIMQKSIIRLKIDSAEFKTVDLSAYNPEREGCTFCGWDYGGEIIASIDKSYFTKSDAISISAVYKSLNFYGVDEKGHLNDPDIPEDQRPNSYVLTLNANGGTIEGEESKQYDYLGGADSTSLMKIFQYIPERKGYIFNGWNSKEDGSGKDYKYMYWRDWKYGESDFEKDGLIENTNRYRNITLYATWTKDPNYFEGTKEISSIDGIKGSVTFEELIDENYKLKISELDIPENLATENVKYLVEILLLNKGQEIVEVNGRKMKIKFQIPDTLEGYDTYKVVYVGRGKIKEQYDATVKDGYITFETTHLSNYGIIATKKPVETTPGNDDNKNNVKDDNNKDNIKDNNNGKGNNINNNIKIDVKKVAIKKVSRTKNNRKIKLKLKKVAGVTGYEIRYSTSKKFGKKGTKTIKVKKAAKTLGKLKKKTYYVKVRAYKVVDGKTYISDWSSVKKIKVRK